MSRRVSIALVMLLAACGGGRRSRQPALAWEPPIEIAAGGGTKGPWQQNDSRYDYVDDPTVAIGADDAAYVAWVDHRDKDVHFQIYGRDGTPRLAQPTNVSRSPAVFSWLPRIVVAPGPSKAVYILWQEIVFSGGSHGGDIYFARSRDGGATFDAPLDLSRSQAGDGKGRISAKVWHNGSLDLALGPDALHAAWTDYEGTLHYTTSHDGGATFAAATSVAGTAVRPARAPSLAVGRDGVVYLAWTHGEDDGADIQLAVRYLGGRFSAPSPIGASPTYSDAPKLGIDAANVLHVAYTETAGDPFAAPRVLYTRSRDRGRTFEAPRTLARNAAFPALVIDEPRVHVAWDVMDGTAARGIGLATSTDRGERFALLGTIAGSRDPAGGTNGSHQGHLNSKLAARDAVIAIVNSSLAPGRGSRVWMLRAAPPRG